jgi:hypothetical protein
LDDAKNKVQGKGAIMKPAKSAIGVTLVILTLTVGFWTAAKCSVKADEPNAGDVQTIITEKQLAESNILSNAVTRDSIGNALKQPLAFTGAERSTLAGLRGVCLKVVLNAPAPVFHLTEQELHRDVEMQLRSYGIKVLPENIYQTDRDTAMLQIKVDWRRIESLRVVHTTCRAYILQIAVLPRSEKLLCTYAITWDAISGTVVRLENLNEVYDNVHEVLDDFIKDYLAANQKEQPVGEEPKPLNK